MTSSRLYDAIVIGSGPNGLAAAITLARAGRSVVIYEAAARVGGSTRSAELTLPRFIHDVCSTVHALALASPFMRDLPLSEHGLELVQPAAPFAHPFDDATAVVVERSVEATAQALGADASAYRRLISPLVEHAEQLMTDLLAPPGLPRHPLLLARFGMSAIRSAASLARSHFRGQRARGLFAGVAAHSILPLEYVVTSAYGLVLLTSAHAFGWPIARGGSQRVADALAAYLRVVGGEIITATPVKSVDELPRARAMLFDVTPRQLIHIAGDHLPSSYRKRLKRFRYGPGVFKIDWALSGPIPWRAAECARAGTVHLGGTLEEIIDSERAAWSGKHHEKPFVLVVQQTPFDPTRAPPGNHTAWAYCHVPNGSTFDMSDRIENQLERFAPGFRDLVLARHVMGTDAMESYNPNLIGGDITGGAQLISQLFTRPVARLNPYSTPVKGLYLCSASTPPGGGVHGMCGYNAARSALKELFR